MSLLLLLNQGADGPEPPEPPAPAPVVTIDHEGDQWASSLKRSHEVVVRGWLLDDGVETELVTITDGTVTLDANAAIRGRCDLTLVDDGTLGLVPDTPSARFAPYGNEIRVERGIRLPDGTVLLVSLGVFRLEDVDVDDSAEGLQIRIVGLDRAARIIDARFEEPYQIVSGTNYGTAILETIQTAYPDVEHDFAETSLTTPTLIAEEGDDRWAFCQSMATAIGMELYFNGDGVLVLSPISLVGQVEPVWDLVEGEGGVLIRAARRWTRQGAFNRVIASGENLSEDIPPARGVATDDNPLSPTYYFGPFGRVPRFYSSPFILTDAQAEGAAQAMLAKELGTTQQVSFGAVVNPALSPSDVVRVERERAGIDEDHVIDTLTIPLSVAGEMSGTTRAVQVT